MNKLLRTASLLCVFTMLLGPTVMAPLAASAQTQGTSSITGSLIDRAGGVPISSADVVLSQGAKHVASTKSAADGTFTFKGLVPGIYTITVRAEGYGGVQSSDVALTPGATIEFSSALDRATTGAEDLKEIGRVSASSGRGQVSTSTTITQNVPQSLITSQGYVRIGDALGTLPGVNALGASGSSSIGDDFSINIRGIGSSEVQTLIDGHPIGAFGPGSGGFAWQDSPGYAIGNTQVTFGSGATGLYGTTAIGGTVDLQTLEPTLAPHFSATQGFGNLGRAQSDVEATGTFGKLGYALVHAVQGTYGAFAPQARVQTGSVGNDFSTANLTDPANLYITSSNYKLTNDLLKLKYSFDDKTQLTVSGLSANSWDDKSGNGDNCYNTPTYQYNQGLGIIAGGPNTFTGSGPNAPSITCNGSIAVNLNSGPTCVTAEQYANLSAGLIAGGGGPWQAHRLHDFHARLTHSFGNNLITADGFQNRFSTDYNRSDSGGQVSTSAYQTTGVLLSDDIESDKNDFGFGFYSQHQRITSQRANGAGKPLITQPEFGQGLASYFIRDNYTFSNKVSAYFNGWLQRDSVTNSTVFDPRLSFIFKLSPSDVFRITAGQSTGDPSPNLISGPVNLTPPVNNPLVNGVGPLSHLGSAPFYLNIGSTSNSALLPETSKDLEVAFGHRFKQDTIIQVDAYYTYEKNRIFGGTFAASSLAPGTINSADLLNYYQTIQKLTNGQITPAQLSLANLAVRTNANAAAGRFQGIELTGRYRFNRRLFADYSYDLQSAVLLGVPDSLLEQNVNTINGSQIPGIPLQRASFGLDFQNLKGFEGRIDTYYSGPNNGYGRIGSVVYSNASLSQNLGKHYRLNFGVQNLFNSYVSIYQLYGTAPYQAENQFGTDTSAAQQGGGVTNGLTPFSYTASLTLKI